MKIVYTLAIIYLANVVYCQQDIKSYNENYGLFDNTYDFPNYDTLPNAPGYHVDMANIKELPMGLHIPLKLSSNLKIHGVPINDLCVEVGFETTERIHVKIYDTDLKQVVVPDSPLGMSKPQIQVGGGRRKGGTHGPPIGSDYEFKYIQHPFGFQIIRVSDKQVLFDTIDLPLVFEDQYIEISTHLPVNGTHIYGLGEVIAPYERSPGVTTIFARDSHAPYENIYGAHPFYMDVRSTGAAHGVFLLNAHGMDVITTKDRITYKVIGGILDFYFFIPPDTKPNSVVQAYTSLVGKPMMPAHWMLGYQNCRYNYTDITEVKTIVQKHKEHGIPLETQWIDIDYMENRKDFTFDPIHFPKEKMIAFSDMLHQQGQKFVVMVDPAIQVNTSYEPYIRGHALDVFVKNVDGSEYQGQVWPGYTVFPDWWHPNATVYWEKEIMDWMSLLHLDGLWIDMNEPSSFCLGSCGSLDHETPPSREPWKDEPAEQKRVHALQEEALNALGQPVGETRNLLYPDFVINNGAGNLSERTMAMTAQHYGNISHYDVHNLYGHAQGYLTSQAILKHDPSTRPMLISRSTFAGSGSHMGHWTGDILSTWEDLKSSISDVLNFQMYGISYSGADICGFIGDTTEELCARWSELGALMYGFARNHNADDAASQEPYLWPSTTEAIKTALGIRYSLLPYIYTLYEESHRLGTGVWRPLLFEFPAYMDALASNDEQFMIGSCILVSPVLEKGATHVHAQFPPGLWYDWYTHVLLEGSDTTTEVRTVILNAPLTHIPIHIKGGSIIPTKTPKALVQATFATPYHLTIALDHLQQATGRVYIDDGYSVTPTQKSSVNFVFTGDVLTVNGQLDYPEAENVGSITLLSHIQLNYTHAIMDSNTFAIEKKHEHVLVVTLDNSLFLNKGFTLQFI